jgi:hypothetical protein
LFAQDSGENRESIEFLTFYSDEAVVALEITVGGFKLWSAPGCA